MDRKEKIDEILRKIKGEKSFESIPISFWVEIENRCSRCKECIHDPIDCYKISQGKKKPFLDCSLK